MVRDGWQPFVELADNHQIRWHHGLAVFKIEKVVDAGAVDLGEQGQKLGRRPAPEWNRPVLQFAEPGRGARGGAVGVEADAGGVSVDVINRLLLGPTMGDPVSGAGTVLVTAGELDRDLVVGHADRAHPRSQLVLLRPLARPTHGASSPGLLAGPPSVRHFGSVQIIARVMGPPLSGRGQRPNLCRASHLLFAGLGGSV